MASVAMVNLDWLDRHATTTKNAEHCKLSMWIIHHGIIDMTCDAASIHRTIFYSLNLLLDVTFSFVICNF